MKTSQWLESDGPAEYVVGVDGSAASLAAARWAAERADRDGARLVLVHAYQVNPLPSVAGPVRTPEMRRTALRHAEQALGGVVNALRTEAAVEPLVVEGPADRVLIERSQGGALLVLGARAQHTRPRMRFLGSVALRCLRGATCPVVMVPQSQPVPAPDAGEVVAATPGG